MKTRLLLFSAALIAAFTLFTGAKSPAGGGITVTVTLDGKPVQGALVGLASSDENRDNSEYIREVESNAKGMVTFSGLEPAMYYLDAFNIINDENFWAEADVKVADGVVSVTMKLMPEEEWMEEE